MPSKRCRASRRRPTGLWIGSAALRPALANESLPLLPLKASFSADRLRRFSGWKVAVSCRASRSRMSWFRVTKVCTVTLRVWCSATWCRNRLRPVWSRLFAKPLPSNRSSCRTHCRSPCWAWTVIWCARTSSTLPIVYCWNWDAKR